ncbi:flagellar biosynthesis protein FlhF [Butyrivibrio sp. MC2013]|uniref:flagellar biosynthesis protein FlhF n=1 Tax=Butyrivibrio sp. MC2013 TaxID=1280686 RepID=UPI0003FE400B|nr:flagellar biosynthesis protein FlhF [Butyrivibrio sp. MC2013]
MIIKKFIGKTEEEATFAAKAELGDGIVVMNVRPVRKAGFWSFLRSPKTEVTVALEEDPDDTPSANVVRPEGSIFSPERREALNRLNIKVGEENELSANSGKESMAEIGKMLSKASRNGSLPPLKVGDKVSVTKAAEDSQDKDAVSDKAGGDALPDKLIKSSQAGSFFEGDPSKEEISKKLDSLHTLLEKNIKNDSSVSDKDKADPNALSAANGAVLHTKGETLPDEMMNFIKLLYNTMLENEVDERYANELTDEVEKFARPGLPLEYTLSNVYQKMILKFGKPEEIEASKNGTKALIFIGPTGVGKTTTIAKLASLLSITKGKKVALITLDTYRIAAAEQLRTYSGILKIPFKIVYSPEEMALAIAGFKDMDFILVDTAGHSVRNDEQKDNTQAFVEALQKVCDTDIFLVMSATTKYRDLIEISDAYKDMFDFKLIFTKMDETSFAGNLYNIKLHTGAPMSYITNGQNVPDDIAVFDPQMIVKSLLGGKTRV